MLWPLWSLKRAFKVLRSILATKHVTYFHLLLLALERGKVEGFTKNSYLAGEAEFPSVVNFWFRYKAKLVSFEITHANNCGPRMPCHACFPINHVNVICSKCITNQSYQYLDKEDKNSKIS